ncbi:MAG: ribosome maturation factor RimM [Janthinobacterium lividum]
MNKAAVRDVADGGVGDDAGSMTTKRQDTEARLAGDTSSGNPFGAFKRRPAAQATAGESAVPEGVCSDVASSRPAADASAPSGKPSVPTRAADDATLPDDLIEIGAIAQAYGVRGQVKIFPHANVGQGGDALLAAPYWWVSGGRPRTTRRIKVLSARVHSGSIAAALSGSDDRDSAEALRGSTVSVRRADFPKLASGEYYWVDLIGLDVVNPAGTALGRVTDLMDNGAHAVLRVGYEASDDAGRIVPGERLIPFVDAYLRDVDLVARRIVVDWDVDY